MSNDLSRVDLWASSGHSVWHRASALSKILFVIVMLGVVLFSHSVTFVATVYAAVCVMVVLAGVPLGPAILLALYPVLFSSLYLLSRWDGSWTLPALLLLRSRVMPRLVGDGLFLTYRAFFLLVARADRMWAASKLRGGLSGRGLPKDLGFAGEGLGQLVIHSYDRSHRLYAVMQLRGHSGRVCGCRHWAEFGWPDLVPLSLAGLALAMRWWWGGR